MSKSWIYILFLMIASNVLTGFFPYVWFMIAMDLVVLGAAYYILKRDPWVNLSSSMIFLSILTAVNILVDLRIIDLIVRNEVTLALILWSWFGAESRILLLFTLGCGVYNAMQVWTNYQLYHYWDIPTIVVSLMGIFTMAYVNR